MLKLALEDSDLKIRAVSPYIEMGAYEALWCEAGASFKTLADRFAGNTGTTPSDFVDNEVAVEWAELVTSKFHQAGVNSFGVRVFGAGEYPISLRDADHPLQLFYYQGWWDLVNSPSIAVVGTRQATKEGLARTRKLVMALVSDDFTVVSGLAAGIDKEAHETAIRAGGRTIAVIGTPLSHTYPKGNEDLQRSIGENFLVVSQVPLKRYEDHDYRWNRQFFPARNITMSALTTATVIVEASDTSGTLYQANAALKQGRKLFILDSCFLNPDLSWPARLEKKGAIRVKDYDDIQKGLSDPSN